MQPDNKRLVIRRSTAHDIAAISSLISSFYGQKSSEAELNWALSDPWNKDAYRSFVALNKDNKVVGHIGYVAYKYKFKGSIFTGVHPVSWIVATDASGPVGLILMKKAIEIGQGGFTYIIGGSGITQEIAKLFRFRLAFHIDNYFKVINWAGYFKMQKGVFTRKILKTLLTFLKSIKLIQVKACIPQIELEKYVGGDIEFPLDDNTLCNDLSGKDVNWLLECPLLDTEAFLIKWKGKSIGCAILYIKERPDNFKTGRIVHLSYIGSNEYLWCGVIAQLERFLKEKGCAVISTLANHPVFKKSLSLSGYIPTRQRRPIFVRDSSNAFSNIPRNSLHLTFCEGDLGYRGM